MKTQFPRQKLKSTEKGPKWQKRHLDWVEDIFLLDDSPIRETLKNRIANYKLYLGTTTKKDYDLLLNPGQLQDIFVPDDIQHYPIAKPYLNVLIGEEADRRFEWQAVVTNPNAISEIEKTKNDMLKKKMSDLIQDSQLPEEEVEKQFKNFLYYLKYEYQDIREKRANLLLKHFIKELDLKMKFNEGFKNALIVGEEAYIADIINDRPVINVMDPKKTYVIRSGYSNRYEDADVIVTYDYWAPGKVIDTYYKHLKNKDITWLDKESTKMHSGSDDTLENDEIGINIARQEMLENMIEMPQVGGADPESKHSEPVDKYGNVRVIKVLWKSWKPIIRVKYYDDLGDVQYRFESEHYIADKMRGEETEQYWVSEWWEGTKVGKDIYPLIKPRDIQYNKFADPGYNHPGVVGQIYNTGNMKVVSYMDTAKPYQYLYDATMHRLQDALAKFFGSLVEVDYASLPEGWNITKWMYFARKAGIAVKDSFKEGNKGAATGKLAASMTGNTGKVINQALGDFIQQQINILNYVEMQMGRIIGVPPQRLGEINNRETVGGVERAVTQSSFITNELFKIHDNVKKRVLTLLLETAKVAMKNNPQKFQHIGDDYLAEIFEIDDEFLEEEYGILIDNDNDLTKLEQNLEQLAHAAMQNQTLKFADIMKLYTSSSMSEKQRIIEQGEEDMMARAAQQQEAQLKQQEAMMQQQQAEALRKEQIELQKHKEDLMMDKYKVDQSELTKRMQIQHSELMSDDQAVNESKRLDAEYQKMQDELAVQMKELDEKIRANKAAERLKAEEIKIKKSAPKPAKSK
jgi:hypothetical protein